MCPLQMTLSQFLFFNWFDDICFKQVYARIKSIYVEWGIISVLISVNLKWFELKCPSELLYSLLLIMLQVLNHPIAHSQPVTVDYPCGPQWHGNMLSYSTIKRCRSLTDSQQGKEPFQDKFITAVFNGLSFAHEGGIKTPTQNDTVKANALNSALFVEPLHEPGKLLCTFKLQPNAQSKPFMGIVLIFIGEEVEEQRD